MVVIDFNSLLNFGQYTFIDTLKGLANALRTDCFLTTDRLSAETPIRQMCSTIQRQLPNKNIFLFRSIPLHGICSDNLSSESERHRNKQKVHIFNKQLYTAGSDNCPALQVPLADRNLLQVDQAIPAYQNIFWHKRECRKDSNMDCCQRLRSGSYCQERTPNQAEFGRNSANSQHCAFRESSYYTSYTNTYEKYVAKRILSIS